MDRALRERRSPDSGRSDGYLAAIFASSEDALYGLDCDGCIDAWSSGAERLFGYRTEVILASPGSRLIPEEQLAAYTTAVDQVLAGELHTHREMTIVRRDGATVPAALTLAPIRDGPDVVGVSVIARDLTEEREALATLAAAEARLREGEALAHVGGWVLDVATGSVQWSAEMHRIHGLDPVEFEGTLEGHLRLVHDDDRASVEVAIARTLTGQEANDAEYRIVRRDGCTRWLFSRAEAVFGAPGANGSPRKERPERVPPVIGLRGICQDVTERRAAEEAIRLAYEREREAVEGLRAADRLKDEFLATVSHELRTPLTAIIGFSHILRGRVDEAMVPDLVARIARNATEMRGMVERVLDFSRLQAGKVSLQLRRVNLDQLVGSTVEGYRAARGDHCIELSLAGGDAAVIADVDATAHVIGNLLSNAVKFSPSDRPITVTTAVEPGAALVTVLDRGPGIPHDLREAVFDRFFQAPDQPPGRRGTGVGLAIVRRYVELQGGRAWCEAPPGGGAALVFSLPLAQKGDP